MDFKSSVNIPWSTEPLLFVGFTWKPDVSWSSKRNPGFCIKTPGFPKSRVWKNFGLTCGRLDHVCLRSKSFLHTVWSLKPAKRPIFKSKNRSSWLKGLEKYGKWQSFNNFSHFRSKMSGSEPIHTYTYTIANCQPMFNPCQTHVLPVLTHVFRMKPWVCYQPVFFFLTRVQPVFYPCQPVKRNMGLGVQK